MAKQSWQARLRRLLIGILFLVGCAPVATTVGMTPTLAPAPTTTAPPPVIFSTLTPIPEIDVGVVEVDLLNVREGPGTNYPSLGSLAKGEKFFILGEVVNSTANRWLLMSTSNNTLGWVAGDRSYVTVQKETIDPNAFLIWQQNMETAKSLLSSLTATP